MNDEFDKSDLKNRTKAFALRSMKLVDSLPKSTNGRTAANQLSRSSTSVGANYRAACRARSKAEFYSKIRIVIEEADECCYWLEIIIESKLLGEERIKDLLNEANELVAIFMAISKTTNSKK